MTRASLISNTHFRHEMDRWHEILPLTKLDESLAFYRKLATKRPQFYQDNVDALEALKREVEQ